MDNYANQYNADLKSYLKTQGKDPSQMASPDAQMLLMLTTLKKQVMGVLKPAQLKRLREVSLQAFGLNGLMDDAVGQKVGLSKDQLDRMRKTFEDGSTRANQMIAGALTPVNNQFKNAKPKTKDEKQKTTSAYLAKRDSALNGVMAQVQKVRADTQNAILAIVTPEQKATYVALQGKPFHAKPAAKPARKK
jgi:hypothetical protein